MIDLRGIADTDFTRIAIDYPVAGLIAVAMLLVALGVFKIHSVMRSRKHTDPLAGLFKSEVFESQVAVASDQRLPPRPAVHGQRAQMQRLRAVWGHDSRIEAIEEVARVMRASKGDTSEPLPIVKSGPVLDAVEWEEIKLLPPPSPQAA